MKQCMAAVLMSLFNARLGKLKKTRQLLSSLEKNGNVRFLVVTSDNRRVEHQARSRNEQANKIPGCD